MGSSRNQVGPQSELDCVPVGHPIGPLQPPGRVSSWLEVGLQALGLVLVSNRDFGYRAGLRASGRVLVSSRAPDIESGLHPDIAGVCEKCRQVDGEGTGVTIVQRC